VQIEIKAKIKAFVHILLRSEKNQVFIEQILLAIAAVIIVAVLAVLNVYYARKYGFFGWLKAKTVPLAQWLKSSRRAFAIVLSWSLFVAILIIREYWLTYINQPILFQMPKYWFDYGDWVAHLNVWDFLLIFASSLIAGALLMDIETILFSAIANVILSFSFSVVYVTYWIWVVLGWGETWDLIGGFSRGGQFVMWDAARIVFRMTFPIVQLIAFLGVFLGAFLRGYFQPSAEP
jgi:hypothetical protein